MRRYVVLRTWLRLLGHSLLLNLPWDVQILEILQVSFVGFLELIHGFRVIYEILLEVCDVLLDPRAV